MGWGAPPWEVLMPTRMRALRARRASAVLATLSTGAVLASGCLNRPIDRLDTRTTSTIVEPLPQSRVDRIDILLAIDNSISMGDKQEILAAAVPDLVNRLITPDCVDPVHELPTGSKANPQGICPEGSKPEFRPVTDINIGIVSSSLGDLATGSCTEVTEIKHPDDKGHLITRKQGSDTEQVPTYQNKGFLAWDPNNERQGEDDPAALGQNLRDLVLGTEQLGCGFEMQLESVYRFLADPDPYLSLSSTGGLLVEQETDNDLLRQRADFLRPDSLVAVIMLSDENDCSINISGRGYQAVIDRPTFYRATDECAVDRNDPCCTSCALANPPGCAPDPETCGPNQGTDMAAHYDDLEDQQGWRCSDQKKRYGINLLYPTERYINALTKARIDPARTDLAVEDSQKGGIPNPLYFADKDGVILPRPPGFVYLAGIVGVPWEAVAKRNEGGQPDLALGFQSVEELEKSGAFEKLVGRPDQNIPPSDPFMMETASPRNETSELLGVSPASENGINGGDRTSAIQDLQYACIFPLLAPEATLGCAVCAETSCDDPLCAGDMQVAAKAYPGTRELAVIRGMGDVGIPASICPRQLTDNAADDYGYAPAVRTIIEKLKENFKGKCLPRELVPDRDGNVACLVLEARPTPPEGCNCDPEKGRFQILPELSNGNPNPTYNAVKIAQQNEFNLGRDCFCEIEQLAGSERTSCQQDILTSDVHGWCYVDPMTIPDSNVELVKDCEDTERRKIRFVGEGEPTSGAVAFITCTGD